MNRNKFSLDESDHISVVRHAVLHLSGDARGLSVSITEAFHPGVTRR